jgi:predicted transposase YdaD
MSEPSKMEEVDFEMTTNIVETLPWIDYREVFEKIEARGEARGETRGEARGKMSGKRERDLEIALNAFRNADSSVSTVVEVLKAAGIPGETIDAAREQVSSERT